MTPRSNSPHQAPRLRKQLIAAAAACLCATPAFAQQDLSLPDLTVDSAATTEPLEAPLATSTLSADTLLRQAPASSDVAGLLSVLPGVSAYAAGGFSSLPSLRGLNDDRVKVLVDGLPIDSACPNHMNPPLSYTDPQTLRQIRVMAGITPVSLGGDSIGGTIAVETADPRFAEPGKTLFDGSINSFYRSNGDAAGAALKTTLASERLHLSYAGSGVRSGNYQGGDQDGVVRSSEYEKLDQTLNLATQSAYGLFELQLGLQHSPYEGFPNQYMDMTFNRSAQGNLRWREVFDWGGLDARAYYRDTEHSMNFLDDKGGSANGGMPMETRLRTAGYLVKADILLSARDALRVGNELQRQSLDDYWPPVPGSMMMGPDTYLNINDGRRTRLGSFVEWQAKWSPRWTSLLGLRNDLVWMNTGDVQPYSSMGMMSAADAAAAAAFNAEDHARRDSNVDATALLRYMPAEGTSLEFGYARKTRSPNLYERYSWGRGSMSSRMIGWFGDGNGYVGNLQLEPEVADTFSASLQLDGRGARPWTLKATPHYSRVHDYVDAVKLKDLSNGFVQLQLSNQEAELYGLDLSAQALLWNSSTLGRTGVNASASWLRGNNLDDDAPLYHQMPFNATLALEHERRGWNTRLQLVVVDAKTRVDPTRVEPQTAGYSLVNLASGYTWGRYRVDFGVDNLFDAGYALPLGGQSLGDYDATGVLRPVPGRGRSVNVGLGIRF